MWALKYSAKCNVVTFSLKSKVLISDYGIDNVQVCKKNVIRDLGVTFDVKMTFIYHYEQIMSSALKNLGFIIRNCRKFQDTETIKPLYFSFVRSKLEFASIIWSPGYNIHTVALEKIQRRFLKFLFFLSFGHYPNRGYPHETLLDMFNVESLEQRRVASSLIFLHKLVTGSIDCSSLLAELDFHVPRLHIRNNDTFYFPTARINLQKFSPIFTMCRNYNLYQNNIDLFNCSNRDIKMTILRRNI